MRERTRYASESRGRGCGRRIICCGQDNRLRMPTVTVYVGAVAEIPAGKPEIWTETLDENPFSAVRLTTV
jgi:hypothetical protein